MKITCDKCGAKYSIADEKVRGKVFKIRCKKCANVVVVRGDGKGEDQSHDAAEPGENEGGWHVVIGRQQVGPISEQDVREKVAQGEIDRNTYVWREGFADWMRIHHISDFSDVFAADDDQGAAAASGAAPGTARNGVGGGDRGGSESAGMFGRGQQPDDRGSASMFAATIDSGGGQSSGASSGAPGASYGATGGSIFPDEPNDGGQGSSSVEPRMTGQRGENSVLFSLANLQSMAAKSTDAAAAPARSGNGISDGKKGSGLIDIRSMAALASTSGTRPTSDEDALPSFGGGFSTTFSAAPVLMPTQTVERPKWIYPALIGMGALLLAAMVGLIFVLSGKDDKKSDQLAIVTDKSSDESAASPSSPKQGVAGNKADNTQVADRDKAESSAGKKQKAPTGKSNSETAGGAKKQGEADSARNERKSSKKASKRSRGKRSKSRSRAAQKKAKAPEAAAPPKPKKRRKKDELDALIDGALGSSGKASRRGKARSSNENLPKRLSRDQIQGGMRNVKGRVQRCYDRFKVPGLANVKVKINSSGRVTSATVKGLFAGTPTGACVERAVKRARFAAFREGSMSFTYPFMLR